MPQPTIAELIDTYPPPPPMTRQTANHGEVANGDYMQWCRGLADLKAARALGVIASAHLSARGQTLEDF